MHTYNINEVFTSFQGEGVHCGEQATFIRAQGCPVGCPWCDSGPNYHPDEPLYDAVGQRVEGVSHVPSAGNTWPGVGGAKMTEYDLCARIPTDIPRIVITGGEPALQDWDDFINCWESYVGHHRTVIALETSGQYEWRGSRWPDWVTVSPKWSGNPWHVEGVYWTYVDELKYVVDDRFDDSIVAEHLRQLRELCPQRGMPYIVLMPEGAPPNQGTTERTLSFLKKHHDWRAGPRLQYDWRVK